MEIDYSRLNNTCQVIPTFSSGLHCEKSVLSWLNQTSEDAREQVYDWHSTVIPNLPQDKGHHYSSDRKHARGRMPSDKGGTKRMRKETERTLPTNPPASTSSLASRPILLPRSTSQTSSPTRSSSPSRDVLDALRIASPSVQCEDQSAQMNEKAMNARRYLSRNFGDAVIPFQLKQKLRTVDPQGFEEISESAFDYHDESSDVDVERLWSTVQRIHLEARECQKYNQDENAWCMGVVQRVLSWGESTSGKDFLELKSLQAQLVDKEYLPTSIENTQITKKIDYALAYSPRDPTTAALYDKLDRWGFPSRSQMADNHTNHLALAAGVEVKQANGKGQEALAQLAIWLAAGLTKLRELQIEGERIRQRNPQQETSLAHSSRHLLIDRSQPQSITSPPPLEYHGPQDPSPLDSRNAGNNTCSKESPSDLLPVIGWTIVGHDWHFYLAFDLLIDDRWSIRVMGPFEKFSVNTHSYLGIFRLLNLIKRMKDWSRDVHWPWLSKEILEPLMLD